MTSTEAFLTSFFFGEYRIPLPILPFPSVETIRVNPQANKAETDDNAERKEAAGG